MSCFERSCPALKEILLKLSRSQKPMEIDHHLYEFGSVEYYIQSLASDPQNTCFLSISTPLLSQEEMLSNGVSDFTTEMVKGICSNVVEIVDPPKQGYQFTLRLDFTKIPNPKESEKAIAKISELQATLISSQLKEMLKNVHSQDTYQGIYKPIKLLYHPRQPFFVIKQSQKIIAVFPMRFKEDSDVVIATSLFQKNVMNIKQSLINLSPPFPNERQKQELVDVRSSEKWARAPLCSWSPIPPPELRGELIEDLSTNAGFVSFEIASRHVEAKRLDKTVWSLLNFYAFVKYHIKSSKGFIQRSMRKRLEGLVQVLHSTESEETAEKSQRPRERRFLRKLVKLPKANVFRQGCGNIGNKIKRIRFRTKILGLGRLRCRCLKQSSFSSSMRYTKLE